ncbi:Transposase, IS4 [Streptococcus lutetiensis 033]|nr:Transposase, IS4 [Streptococcus lutetiensis 033]
MTETEEHNDWKVMSKRH